MNTHLFSSLITSLVIIGAITYSGKIKLPSYHVDKAQSIQRISPPQSLAFTDETIAWGIVSEHAQRSDRVRSIADTLGAGVCAFDYDNDGWIDLFIIGGSGPVHYSGHDEWWSTQRGNRLYRNTGHANFVDVTQQAGITDNLPGMGCLAADLDNDGDDDLLITNNGRNQLLSNNGDGGFIDVSETSGLDGNQWSTTASVADIDGDGLLDLYIANYIDFSTRLKTLEAASGPNTDQQRLFDPALFQGVPNQLFKNTGNLSFEAISAPALTAPGRTLSSHWLDLNNDQNPDLIVLNDQGSANQVLISNGDFSFEDISDNSALATLDRSANISLLTTHNNASSHTFTTTSNQRSSFLTAVSNTIQPDKDVTQQWQLDTALNRSANGFASIIEDFNQDGYQDILQVNGISVPSTYAPQYSQGQPDQLWLNNHDQSFTHCEHCINSHLNASSRSAVSADFDNDGDLDIYISRNNDLGQLLINPLQPQHWIGVQFSIGEYVPSHAALTFVLSTDNGKTISIIKPKTGFLSTSDNRIMVPLTAKQTKNTIQLAIYSADTQLWSTTTARFNRYIRIHETIAVNNEDNNHETDTVTKLLSMQLPFTRNDHNFQALNWLIQQNNHTHASRIATELSQSDNLSDRLIAAKISAKIKSFQSLGLLFTLQDDPSVDVRAAVIESISAFNTDLIMPVLVNGLYDNNAEIRCAAARSLGKFFDIEEHLIRSKSRSIPHLLQGLTSLDDEETILCYINSLGKSENYRVGIELIEFIHSKSLEVQLAAIKALGTVREKQAIQPLIEKAHTALIPATLRAQILLVLKQLGVSEKELIAQLKSNINLHEPSIFSNIIDMALTLHTVQQHNIGFSVEPIVQWLYKHWLTTTAGENTTAKLFTLMVTTHSTISIDNLEYYLQHTNDNLRLASLKLAVKDIHNNHAMLLRFISRETKANLLLPALHALHTLSRQEREAFINQTPKYNINNKNHLLPAVALFLQHHYQQIDSNKITSNPLQHKLLTDLYSSSTKHDDAQLVLWVLGTLPHSSFTVNQCLSLLHQGTEFVKLYISKKWQFCYKRGAQWSEIFQQLNNYWTHHSAKLNTQAVTFLLHYAHLLPVKQYIHNIVVDASIDTIIKKQLLTLIPQSLLEKNAFWVRRLMGSEEKELAALAIDRYTELLNDADLTKLSKRFEQSVKNSNEYFILAKALMQHRPEQIVDRLFIDK